MPSFYFFLIVFKKKEGKEREKYLVGGGYMPRPRIRAGGLGRYASWFFWERESFAGVDFFFFFFFFCGKA